AGIKTLRGGDAIMRRSRTPDILADAAYVIFTKPAKSFTGQFLIDDTFLAREGVPDFDAYRVDPSQPLSPDFFVPDSSKPPPGVSLAAKIYRAPHRNRSLSSAACAVLIPRSSPGIWKHSLDLPIGLSPRPRDGSVVSSLHRMNDPQPEGHIGKLHRTPKILGHASRWRCCVATC